MEKVYIHGRQTIRLMRKNIVFSALALMVLLVPVAFAQESKFTEEYGEHIVDEYIESTPEDGWNIFVFEEKFGPNAAVCYLAGIILMALVLKHLMK